MAGNFSDTDMSRVQIAAPASVNAGAVVVRNNIVGVALTSAASGAEVTLAVGGCVVLPKSTAAGETYAIGANVHWDATNAVATVSATSNVRIGAARRAVAANTVTTVEVILRGTPVVG